MCPRRSDVYGKPMPSELKVGAVCGNSACTDLCRGAWQQPAYRERAESAERLVRPGKPTFSRTSFSQARVVSTWIVRRGQALDLFFVVV